MKKIVAMLSVSMLAACVYAGNMDIFSGRNKIFQVWQTEKIFYYDAKQGEEYLTESKTVTEDKIERNQVLVTKLNDVMLFSKTRRTDFYASEVLTVNKDAVLSSSYTPMFIKKNGNYEAFGEVSLNNQQYMLVRENKGSDILLVDGDGSIYNHIGRIVDGRLAILDIEFFVEPDDVTFTPVVNTRSETTDVLSGYELRYNGVEDGLMRFTYTTFGEEPVAEEYTFPFDQEDIEIAGFKINVISAGYNRIEYVIL